MNVVKLNNIDQFVIVSGNFTEDFTVQVEVEAKIFNKALVSYSSFEIECIGNTTKAKLEEEKLLKEKLERERAASMYAVSNVTLEEETEGNLQLQPFKPYIEFINQIGRFQVRFTKEI